MSIGVDSWENVANHSDLNRLEGWLGPTITWQQAGKESEGIYIEHVDRLLLQGVGSQEKR